MIKNNQLWDLKHDQDSFSKETVKRVKYSVWVGRNCSKYNIPDF